jgi:hypothetical protein
MSKLQIAFSFDTTGSMYPILSHVKKNLIETIKNLLSINNNAIEIALLAHGGYDLNYNKYDVIYMDFSRDIDELSTFIKNTEATGGSQSGHACYELSMRYSHTELTWTDSANKCLVMIGDDLPFDVDEQDNKNHVDWKHEIQQLKSKNIKIYSVKCLDNCKNKSVYQEWAQVTNGYYLEMHQFQSITDFMMAIAINQTGKVSELELYKQELERQNKLTRNMSNALNILSNNVIPELPIMESELHAVNPARFQVMDVGVGSEPTIKQFVIENGIEFKSGRGFYAFTKQEEISPSKEIILMDVRTGDMFEGEVARSLANIGDHIKGKKQKPPAFNKWLLFIQSKSSTRRLQAGTKFLYEA